MFKSFKKFCYLLPLKNILSVWSHRNFSRDGISIKYNHWRNYGGAQVFSPPPPSFGSTYHNLGNNLTTYKELYLLHVEILICILNQNLCRPLKISEVKAAYYYKEINPVLILNRDTDSSNIFDQNLFNVLG